MKRVKLIFMGVLIMFVSVLAIAQDVVPPDSIIDVFLNFNTWIGTLAGVAALSVFLTELVNSKVISASPVWLKRVVSWVVPSILIVIGNLANLGFMAELTWLQTAVFGVGAGLVSNGIFDIEIVQQILIALKLKKVEEA